MTTQSVTQLSAATDLQHCHDCMRQTGVCYWIVLSCHLDAPWNFPTPPPEPDLLLAGPLFRKKCGAPIIWISPRLPSADTHSSLHGHFVENPCCNAHYYWRCTGNEPSWLHELATREHWTLWQSMMSLLALHWKWTQLTSRTGHQGTLNTMTVYDASEPHKIVSFIP